MFCRHCGKKIEDGVKFCPSCGCPTEVQVPLDIQKTPVPKWEGPEEKKSPKSRLVAALLAFFVGWLGIHRFYVGKVGTGILQILTCWCLIGEIWALVDLVFILCGKFTDKKGRIISEWDI